MNTAPSDGESRLDDLFRAYRAAFPEPLPSATFTPELWAKIEAAESSTTWFGRVARVLVTSALAASAILGMILSSTNQSSDFLTVRLWKRSGQTARPRWSRFIWIVFPNWNLSNTLSPRYKLRIEARP